MQESLTILTTADADEAIMGLFAEALARSGLHAERQVTWLVIDGLLAYREPPGLAKAQQLFELKWIAPSAPLPQLGAIMHGLSLTRGPVVIMDPDMPGNIDDIRKFMAAHHNGADIVFGRRLHRHGISPVRRFFTAIYNFTARNLLGLPIHDLNTPMISITRNVVDLIRAAPPGCPSPRFYVFNQLSDGLGEIPICVSELEKKSSYSPMSRASLGIARLSEILKFISWKIKTSH